MNLKQVMSTEISRVRAINKETPFNKRGIPRLVCRGVQSRPSKTGFKNSTHHGELVAKHFGKDKVLQRPNG